MSKIIKQPWRRYAIQLNSIFLLSFLCLADAMADVPDPEQWFRTDYAPIWRVSADLQSGLVASFYHSEIIIHEPGEGRGRVDSDQWIDELLTTWASEGWLGSTVPDIRAHRINETTTTFTTRWLDRYEGGETEYSCGWYLADYLDGQWQFTHYAEMDCAAQGF